MTAQPPEREANIVRINRGLSVMQSQEPGVAIEERHYRRYIERLDGCKPHGWSDLWLAVSGIGAGLSAAALVTVLTLPSTVPSADKDILWMLVILGGVVLGLCLLAYFTQRDHHEREIDDLKKDLEMHMGVKT